MNKYYSNNEQFNSNRRIFEAYFTEVESRPSKLEKCLNRILSILAILLSAITCQRARSLAKTAIVVGCLIGLVGVIGAMEQGTVSLLSGFFFASIMIFVEFLCLKKVFKA